MVDERPLLTLAHSPDPDDAFMWWPITGKIRADGEPHPGAAGLPVIDTGMFRYRAVPADIEVLNRRAADSGDYDITAISFRNYANVSTRYALARCGSSFGDGFGPKVVARSETTESRQLRHADAGRGLEWLRSGATIAVPGKRTTAFLVLGLMLGPQAMSIDANFIEMPFEQIIPAVAKGEVQAGLVIHEGQVLYERAGLFLVVDLGVWWKKETGLPLPLGANAVRRDLDARHGAGALADVSRTLRASVDHALAHRNESLEYTMPFAQANRDKSGEEAGERPTLERVDRYVAMYVNRWTVDMGDDGLNAVRTLFQAGARSGLCGEVGEIEIV